jgi:hypothetical protein
MHTRSRLPLPRAGLVLRAGLLLQAQQLDPSSSSREAGTAGIKSRIPFCIAVLSPAGAEIYRSGQLNVRRAV